MEPNAASVALVEKGRVLLIRRARAPYAGLWTLPGGRREAGETAEACALRELREELGFEATALQLVATSRLRQASGIDWVLATFATDAFSGNLVPSDEIAGYRWIVPAATGGLRTTRGLFPILEAALRAVHRA